MRTSPLLFSILTAALLAAGAVTVHAAGGRFYDPSNAASPTGTTLGYELYRTIGCPGRELIGSPCLVSMPPVAAAPVPAPAPAFVPTPPPVVVAAPKHVPVIAPAPTPPPAPVLVVVPVPARNELYCAILDIQFEIDKDEIQREEKEKLAVLGTYMKKYPETSAVIEGHTDSVGTDEDNMRLSQRRADSVVAYLTNNLGIAPNRVAAMGYGETRPVADNESEEGKRMNRRIDAVIACVSDIEGLTVAPARVTMALQMEFDRDQTAVKPEYDNDLRKVANFLKTHPGVTATVEGHTGNLQATPEQAREISRNRARNVVNYLVDNFDIPRSSLSAEGFGETRRFAYNTSLEGQQENRRVNIIFNYPRR